MDWVDQKCTISSEYIGLWKRWHYKEKDTVFENRRKSLISQHCERSELRLHFGQKLLKNAKNGQFWRVFENVKLAVKQCYQTGQF